MIKFFRKIRYNFMEIGKTGKYFKYAIGEIVLVMIGILLALQVNNWNENRINSSKEYEYLIGLKNDLITQIKDFKEREQFYDRLIEMGESILSDFSAKESLSKIDSINVKLSFMMYSLKYPDIKTTFNELSTTGQLNLIKEKSLRSIIIRYYQYSESQKESVNSNINEVFYNHIFPYIKSAIIIHPENFNFTSTNNNEEALNEKLASTFYNNLKNPTQEFELINAISLRTIVAQTNKGSIKNVLEFAEFVLEKINSELDN